MAPREAPVSRALNVRRETVDASDSLFSPAILGLKPHRLVSPANWAGHLPFAFWLVAVERPNVLVELGTYAGTSYCGFCQAVQHLQLSTACFAIDTWRGDAHAGSYGAQVFEELAAYHDPRYGAFSSLIRSTFDDARDSFPDGSINLLHVDGCHEYEAVRHDVESWLPKLSARGVILLHDVAEGAPGFGTSRFWDEFARRYPSFTFVHSHGLGVAAVGAEVSPELRWLTDRTRSAAEIEAIRAEFVAAAADLMDTARLKDAVRMLQHANADLGRQVEQATRRQAHAEARCRAAERQIAEDAARFERRAALAEERLRQLQLELATVTGSKSWRLMAPFRDARRTLGRTKYGLAVRSEDLLRRAYHRLPIKSQHRWAVKTLGFRASGWLMRGTASYQRWQGTMALASSTLAPAPVALTDEDVPRLLDTVRLPAVDQPLVSVVIPVHGKLPYTARCLAAISAHRPTVPTEVIVVDDGSGDATFETLERVAGLRVLRNEACLGFIGSCNRGAREARGTYLLFLNNDTEVQPHWCDELVRTFSEVPDAGIVGSKLVYPDGRLQEAGGIVWRDGSAWNYGRMEDPRRPAYNFRREADYVSGAALAVPRALFLEVGGFDARYAPAYYEDVDLAFKVREAGRRVLYQPRSVVVHHEGVTAGRDVRSGVKAHQVRNARTFYERWRGRLLSHYEPGRDVVRAAARSNGLRVLFLDHCTPEPDKDAGSTAVVNVFRILQQLGGHVTFIPEDNYLYLEPYTADLQRMGIQCLHAPYVTSVEQHLQAHGAEYDVVFMYRYRTGMRHLAAIRRYAPAAKVVLLDVDLHFLREAREAALRNEPAVVERAARVKVEELDVISRVDYTMVHSMAERDVLARECPSAPVAVFGWVADVVGTTTGWDSRRDLVFIGGFQHPPNVDAVVHFVRDVLPLIRERIPDVRLHVIGSNPPTAVRELASDAVLVMGYVPDLQPVLDTMRVAVAPVRFGAGVKGKVATALAHGLPTVTTSIGAEGVAFEPGRDLLVGDSPEAFADAVCTAYLDPARWSALSDAGVAFVRREFAVERGAQAIAGVLDALGVAAGAADLEIARFSSQAEYDEYISSQRPVLHRRARVEDALVPPGGGACTVPGFCVNCGREVDLAVALPPAADGSRPRPNWREQLMCRCGLNTRMRAALHLADRLLALTPDQDVYLMEHTTAFARALRARWTRLITSEYLGDCVPRGESHRGIRNEDATRLTFADEAFDAILSFEVFEHIPDYHAAFREAARCLRPGGRLFFTAPFVTASASTRVRARIGADGEIEHLAPPEYHGDPVGQGRGILCYQHFGWDVLKALTDAGFAHADAALVWSRRFGYLGGDLLLFTATRPHA